MRIPRTLALLGLGPALLLAQQPSKPAPDLEADAQPTIRTEVDVVNVLATVRNKQGGLVGNLNKEDFLVGEDGTIFMGSFGTPVFSDEFFGMRDVFDAFAPRSFPLFD